MSDALLNALTEELGRGRRHLPEPPADLGRYAPADLEMARIQWLNRLVQEHRSVVDFADLLALLADIDAPYETLCALERVLRDEMRHVSHCRTVVDWLGGSDDLQIDLTRFRRPRPEVDDLLEHAIMRVTEEVFVAELASLPVQRAHLRRTTEPAIAAVVAMLLEDEGMHAAIGKAMRNRLLEIAPPPDRPRLERAAGELEQRMLRDMRAFHRACARGGPGSALGGSLSAADIDDEHARMDARHLEP